ncbi:hypothetical protein T484DRAFT_3273087 [Baffinella frigidus]|nr:hypothetical protein T484DRAFT_3273087 [Cryptophyta sp. CCMP2293]
MPGDPAPEAPPPAEAKPRVEAVSGDAAGTNAGGTTRSRADASSADIFVLPDSRPGTAEEDLSLSAGLSLSLLEAPPVGSPGGANMSTADDLSTMEEVSSDEDESRVGTADSGAGEGGWLARPGRKPPGNKNRPSSFKTHYEMTLPSIDDVGWDDPAVRSVPNMAARNADKKFPKMSALNTGYAMHVGKMSEQVVNFDLHSVMSEDVPWARTPRDASFINAFRNKMSELVSFDIGASLSARRVSDHHSETVGRMGRSVHRTSEFGPESHISGTNGFVSTPFVTNFSCAISSAGDSLDSSLLDNSLSSQYDTPRSLWSAASEDSYWSQTDELLRQLAEPFPQNAFGLSLSAPIELQVLGGDVGMETWEIGYPEEALDPSGRPGQLAGSSFRLSDFVSFSVPIGQGAGGGRPLTNTEAASVESPTGLMLDFSSHALVFSTLDSDMRSPRGARVVDLSLSLHIVSFSHEIKENPSESSFGRSVTRVTPRSNISSRPSSRPGSARPASARPGSAWPGSAVPSRPASGRLITGRVRDVVILRSAWIIQELTFIRGEDGNWVVEQDGAILEETSLDYLAVDDSRDSLELSAGSEVQIDVSKTEFEEEEEEEERMTTTGS